MGQVKAIDRRQLRRNFSVHAEEYDTYAAVQKRVVNHLSQQIAKRDRMNGPILDIGTGTGALAAAIQALQPDQPLLVMDSVAMVVNVGNRTVITCVGRENMQDNVFTNIDSAAVI